MRKSLSLLILSVLFALPSFGAEILQYKVIVGGNPNGMMRLEQPSATEWRAAYEFNDRGRGPKLNSTIRFDENWIPQFIEVAGNNYLKVAVQERFTFEGSKAAWKNSAEEGTKEITKKAFYVTFNSVPAETGLLARALLKSPDQRLVLLPEGEAQIGKAGELKVNSGGQSQLIVQYLISGLDFTPFSVWMDQEGNYFASGSDFFFVVREGWEANQKAILAAQEEALSAWLAKIAKELKYQPSKGVVIRNANLFDSETASTKAGQAIVVEGKTVTYAGPDQDVKIPEGAEVIDAAGKMVLPGLWDMHVHVGPSDGLLHIAAGVTSVRDLANNPDDLLKTRAKFDSAEIIGPHIPVIAGFIDGPGPYAGPTRTLVDNEEQAKQAVDKYASLGFQQIKLYSSLKPELVKPIVAMAKEHGMRVSGHIPAFMTAEQAVRDGYDEIQHLNMIFLNFLFDTVKDTRTPQRFIGVAENAANMDLKSEKVQSFIALLKEKNIIVDPTVAIFEGMFNGRPGSMAEGHAKIADRLPPQVRRGLLNAGLPVPEGKDQLYRDSYKKMIEMVGELYKNNITLVAGTDDMPGFTLQRELELYVAAGIPAAKALQIATFGSAKVAKMDRHSGSIAAGKVADLIIVNGNPAENISDIRRVDLVMKDGTIYQPAGIYRSIGVNPRDDGADKIKRKKK